MENLFEKTKWVFEMAFRPSVNIAFLWMKAQHAAHMLKLDFFEKKEPTGKVCLLLEENHLHTGNDFSLTCLTASHRLQTRISFWMKSVNFEKII